MALEMKQFIQNFEERLYFATNKIQIVPLKLFIKIILF